MKNQWTSTEIARMESRRHIWRDSRPLVIAMWPLWVMLVSLSLAIGLLWHFSTARAPDIYALLDVCGLTAWLAGWPLAKVLASTLRRIWLFQSYQVDAWQRWPYIAQSIFGISIGFALAPSGLLLGYSLPTTLQEISTQEIPQINLSLGGLAITGMVIGGSCVLLLSSAVALLSMRIGRRLSPFLWLAAGSYVHLSTLGGLSEHIRRVTPGGEVVFSWVPPTLGVLTRLAMARLADPGLRYEYLQSFGGVALAAVTLAILALLAINLYLARNAPQPVVVDSSSICALGGSLAAAIYFAAQNWVYIGDPSVSSPGYWSTLFTIASIGNVALCYLLQKGFEYDTISQVTWPTASLLVVLGLTSLQIRVGQVSHLEVLTQFLLLLPLLLATLLMLRRPADHPSLLVRQAALGVFILLVVPIAGHQSIVDLLRGWSLQAGHFYMTIGVASLILLVIGATWLVPARRQKKQTSGLRPAA